MGKQDFYTQDQQDALDRERKMDRIARKYGFRQALSVAYERGWNDCLEAVRENKDPQPLTVEAVLSDPGR